jgi:hypothetical protein
MKTKFEDSLLNSKKLHVQQILEGIEIFTGFETRNKYRILNEDMTPLAFAAEPSTGLSGALMRGIFKHWRSFKIEIFNKERELLYRANFPFRWFFKSLYLEGENGSSIGHLQARFALFYKKFDLYDSRGIIIARVKSPLFKFWTFEFRQGQRKIGTVQKKWSGTMSELFTDRDNFTVTYAQADLSIEIKALMLAACLMVDIIYFENNKGSGMVIDSLRD